MSVGVRLFLLLGGLTLVRLFVAGNVELSLDEGYYWQWASHLDFGYYDHPPMVALMIAFTTIFSDSEIFIRLGPIAGAVASSLLLHRLTACLYADRSAGFNAVLIANLTLVFSAGSLFATPDAALIPFYLAAMIVFFRAVSAKPGDRGSATLWTATGLLAGCALLCKYTAAFFFPCALAYLALEREGRGWLKRPEPYVSALVSLAVFSPVLFWNARHGWISISFQAGHGLSGASGNPLAMFAEFLGFQAVLYSIGLFVFLLFAFFSAGRRGLFGANGLYLPKSNLFLFSFSAPPLLFFFLNAFRSRMEGNWPVLAFLPLAAQAGAMTFEWLASKKSRTPFVLSMALAALLTAAFHLQLFNPVIPHPQRHEISRRVYGWKILGEKIGVIRKEFPAAFLISNRHQVGTLMTYYTAPHIPSYLLGANNRRLTTFLPPPDAYKGQNAIYITEQERDESPRLAPLFERIEKVETVEITRKGELIRRFLIFRCYNYRGGLEGI